MCMLCSSLRQQASKQASKQASSKQQQQHQQQQQQVMAGEGGLMREIVSHENDGALAVAIQEGQAEAARRG